MQTNGIYFTRFIYQLDNVKETVSKYYLTSTEPMENNYLFTEWVQIERNFGKNNCTDIDFWLRKRDKPNWSDSDLVTGLRETTLKGVYYGDEVNSKGRKSLLLVQVCADLGILVIDYFKNFNPYSLKDKLKFIDLHQFEYPTNEVKK